MTSPPEKITVRCPECGERYEDWYRASVNLALDDFDEEYLSDCSTATCPACGREVKFDLLVVDRDGTFITGHPDKMTARSRKCGSRRR
jgi:NAD-dependent SIR2 family protein deacetylase